MKTNVKNGETEEVGMSYPENIWRMGRHRNPEAC